MTAGDAGVSESSGRGDGHAPDGSRRLTREAFVGDAIEVAQALLGCVVVHESPRGRVEVRLTETEAYLGEGEDPGSHAHRGRTARNASMFGPPGHLYMYFTYGMHWCGNLVTGAEGRASAVLLRAGEVVRGLESARARRPACTRDVDLARGPARLATCLALDGAADGMDACGGGPLWVRTAPSDEVGDRAGPRVAISSGPRVGVSGVGGVAEWRFWLADDPTVSRYRAAVRRPVR